MLTSTERFHLALPCTDIDETVRFYERVLGCRLGRHEPDRAILDFFGMQLVFRRAPDEVDGEAKPYPRHFGVIFERADELDALISRARVQGVEFLVKPFVRFEGRPEEHRSVFLADPSRNVLEFKHYRDASTILGGDRSGSR